MRSLKVLSAEIHSIILNPIHLCFIEVNVILVINMHYEQSGLVITNKYSLLFTKSMLQLLHSLKALSTFFTSPLLIPCICFSAM